MNRYELNIAVAGRHYCRIEFEVGLTKQEALRRAAVLCCALNDSKKLVKEGLSFRLTEWTPTIGHEVSIPKVAGGKK